MSRAKATVTVMILSLTILVSGLAGDDFDVGLTYYLLNDLESARPFFNRFFVSSNNQRVADAYVELFKNNNWDAAERFKRYLDMNHRSLIAIIGMSLSTRHLRNSTSLETLERAQRLHPRSPAVHVAIGYEYFNRKDFPKAEEYFARALNYGKEEIYKIPLAYLYLEMNDLAEVLAMTEKNALADTHNFHFNYLAAKAHYQLNDWSGVGQFIQNAIKANPQHIPSRLLWAQFLVRQKRPAEARDALQGMHFEGYNLDYEKVMAQVLFDLEDRQAYGKMLEVLVQAPWDKDINRMMGLHHLREAKGENIQHWINRALIAGNSEADISALFPAKYTIKAPFEMPFFSITAMAWLDDQYLLFGGKRKSGDKDQVFVLDTKSAKIVSSGTVLGNILQIRTSGKSSDWAVIDTVAKEDQSIYIYSLTRQGNAFSFKPIAGSGFRMTDFISAFSADGQKFYFVSSNLTEALYQAPFTVFDEQYQRRPLFPNLPLPVYVLDRKGGAAGKVQGISQIARLPIKELRDFALLSQAYQKDKEIQTMINEGYSIDLAASRTVKAYCNSSSDGAIVYITDVDAKRGFDAVMFSAADNHSLRLNETAFMGKNKYAEVEVIFFDPLKGEFVVRTLGDKKELIHHHIKGKLTRILGENVLSHLYLPRSKTLYFLIEKKQKLFEKETQLFQIVLEPFSKSRVKKREDIITLQMARNGTNAEFVTFNGEILLLDLENEFTYLKPALNTLLHAVSANGTRAAFLNDRIVIGI